MTEQFRLNWFPWVYGLFAGFIGGGAAAVSTGVAQSITDPMHADIHHLFNLMGVSFIVAGAIATSFYLAKSPLPTPIQVEVTKTSTTKDDDGKKVVTEVKVSGQVPQEQTKKGD